MTETQPDRRAGRNDSRLRLDLVCIPPVEFEPPTALPCPATWSPATMDAETAYQCPGEAYEISRSVHLGRLASFYPACGGCLHRRDKEMLSARRAKLLGEVHRHAEHTNPLFHREGISGVYLNEIGPETARRIGQALGIAAFSSRPDDDAPQVLIAADGRPWTSELAAAAADGLRWSGCNVVDLGTATAPCLALAAARHDAAGTLLVGNHSSKSREVGFSLGGRHGEPMSSPGALDAVRELFHSPAPRPSRPFGGIERLSADGDYLSQFEEYYHALRPLHLVVGTTSLALMRYLERLTSTVAVEIEFVSGASLESARITEQVRAARGHFGIWVDGDGEACRLFDELGEPVTIDALVALIIQEILIERPAARIVRAENSSNRQSIWKAIREQSAAFAADREGRIWYAGPPTCADALWTVTRLLTLLSRGDRPLSELIASAILW
jgi:phosphomannomutase